MGLFEVAVGVVMRTSPYLGPCSLGLFLSVPELLLTMSSHRSHACSPELEVGDMCFAVKEAEMKTRHVVKLIAFEPLVVFPPPELVDPGELELRQLEA